MAKGTNGGSRGPQVDVRRIVKDVINSRVEHKRCSVDVAVADMSASGTVQPITQNVTTGDTLNTRDGNQIYIEKLSLRLVLRQLQAAMFPINVRVIVFSDKLNVGSIPSVTDVLSSAATNAGYNMLNIQKGRFKIYHDQIVDLVGQTSAAIASKTYNLAVGKTCFYSGETYASTSNGAGAMFMLVLSSATSAGIYTYQWGFTLTFVDA